MIIVLLGPPGGGKGTQAKRMSEQFGFLHYSTGQILRQEVQNETEIGRQAKGIMEAGDLVPDEILGELVRARLEDLEGTPGCILDGYPRTLSQAEFLDTIRSGLPLLAINVVVPPDQIVKRLSGRRFCPGCGNIYNIHFSPPLEAGICDRCGTALERRRDDYEDVIEERIRVYNELTCPVVRYYQARGTYRKVDGNKDPDTVFEEVCEALEACAA